jgi:hypothetical protein
LFGDFQFKGIAQRRCHNKVIKVIRHASLMQRNTFCAGLLYKILNTLSHHFGWLNVICMLTTFILLVNLAIWDSFCYGVSYTCACLALITPNAVFIGTWDNTSIMVALFVLIPSSSIFGPFASSNRSFYLSFHIHFSKFYIFKFKN